MARSPQKVSVTYAFGRRDRVDPKLAPFGVLKFGRNLRVRKDGRLGVRDGYQPLNMSTANGSVTAYDLHEYQGRLIALGSDAADGFPTDLFEYVGGDGTYPWRGTDPAGQRVTQNPFTNLREVAGIPQPDDGVTTFDAAIGAGVVCLVYVTSLTTVRGLVVDASTNQTLHAETFDLTGSFQTIRVVFSGGTFYIGILTAGTQVDLFEFTPRISIAFEAYGTAITAIAFDMCAVSNASTARIAVAVSTTGPTETSVRVFDADGAAVGSTIFIAGETIPVVEADEADDTINVVTSSAVLRTYDFAATLLNGPTAVTGGGVLFSTCRLPALPFLGFGEHVAVAATVASNTTVQFWDIDAHTLSGTVTVQRSSLPLRGKIVSGQSNGQPMAVVFAALVGPDLVAPTFDASTNALFYATPDVAHMTTRDFGSARRAATSVSRDTDGTLCWVAARDPGVNITMPVVTLVDFQSTARRAAVTFGGLLYFAGGTPSVYDGRFCVPLNFNEVPAIISAASSATSGPLVVGATYLYIVIWEYTLADGSVIVGPPSAKSSVTIAAGHGSASVTVGTPHTVSVAAGDALFGANVSAALYRTDWNAVASTPGSVYRRCQTVPVPIGMANYGATLTISDTLSDNDIGDEEILYTQDERLVINAPLVHTAPSSCDSITATEARLLIGGLTHRGLVQVSKSAYLNEAFEFNPIDVYFSSVSGDVVGVRSLDGNKFVFTSDAVFALSGDGPDDIGVGTLSAPVAIPSPGGLSNKWSFLDAPDGLWFQLDNTKLFRIPRGGGAPTWEGVDIQDALLECPTITGTCKVKRDNAGIFACESESDASFLVRDFRTEQWFIDVPFVDAIDERSVDAVAPFGDAFAYLSFGTVYQQVPGSYADGPEFEFIETSVVTQPLYPFGVGGYGQIYEMLLTGEYRADCRLTASVSYDDGLTFTTLEPFDLLDLSQGQTIQRKWTLPQDITSSIVIQFATEEGGGDDDERGATEGFVFNQVDLLVGPEEGLRELDPPDMA